MATKTHLLIFFSFALMALSIADATIPILLPPTRFVVNINGTVFCTANGGPGVNGSATPVFPNALVQLRRLLVTVVASTTTNSAGIFAFNLTVSPTTFVALSTFQLRVQTPLATCNSTLSANRVLTASLRFIETVRNGTTIIARFAPGPFVLTPRNI